MTDTDLTMQEIMDRIKSKRLQLGYSYQDLAQLTGMSKSTLQRYETGGIKNVPLSKLQILAAALNTSPEYLLGWEETSRIFGQRIKELRESKYLSQDEFAVRLGLTESDIHDWESGKKEPTQEFAQKVCHEFNVSFDWLQHGLGSLYEYDSLLIQVAEKYNLNEFEQMVVSKYLTLSDRSGLTQFLQAVNKGEKDLLAGINEQAAAYDIPLLGKTAAGAPLTYSDPSYEAIGVKTIPKGAEFALTVSGDSMEPIIKDGSIVFVKPQPTAENGQIIIAEVDGEVTCKKFYKHEDGEIELRSINPKYDPITNFETIRIIGKVIL